MVVVSASPPPPPPPPPLLITQPIEFVVSSTYRIHHNRVIGFGLHMS